MEWLWIRKYEYLVKLKKMACSSNNLNKNIAYGNIMLILVTTDKLILSHFSEIAW